MRRRSGRRRGSAGSPVGRARVVGVRHDDPIALPHAVKQDEPAHPQPGEHEFVVLGIVALVGVDEREVKRRLGGDGLERLLRRPDRISTRSPTPAASMFRKAMAANSPLTSNMPSRVATGVGIPGLDELIGYREPESLDCEPRAQRQGLERVRPGVEHRRERLVVRDRDRTVKMLGAEAILDRVDRG
jgi:hypothetical protein